MSLININKSIVLIFFLLFNISVVFADSNESAMENNINEYSLSEHNKLEDDDIYYFEELFNLLFNNSNPPPPYKEALSFLGTIDSISGVLGEVTVKVRPKSKQILNVYLRYIITIDEKKRIASYRLISISMYMDNNPKEKLNASYINSKFLGELRQTELGYIYGISGYKRMNFSKYPVSLFMQLTDKINRINTAILMIGMRSRGINILIPPQNRVQVPEDFIF